MAEAIDGEVAVRSVRTGEIDDLIPYLIRNRAHISGSRRPAVYRAFLADAVRPRPLTTVVIAEVDGQCAGTALVVNSDLPAYYRAWMWRHPVAAAQLVGHRARKLPYRLRRRRRLRAATHTAPPAPLVPPAGPPGSGADAPEPPAWGPRPEQGPGVAFCVYVLVDHDRRGHGIGKLLVEAALGNTRALGSTRFDCSFDLTDPAASRLYPSLGFTVTRTPTGGFASLALAGLTGRRLAA
ncbi:GNAT family N-acetyltransferase [Aquihabitans sp. McL0605]|uniref:GNAT family N-acetyltransferase n=1 Tax=Aquihabitans sp. McL0605 TaxID=3415671 RepID=UPI003CEBB5F7